MTRAAQASTSTEPIRALLARRLEELSLEAASPADLERLVELLSRVSRAFDESLVDATVRSVQRAPADRVGEVFATLLETLDDPELLERVGVLVPRVSPWTTALGPVYDTGALCRHLGVKRQAISERKRHRTLLALETRDGRNVFPAFQFDEHFCVLPGLVPLLQLLDEEVVDPWTLASWLRTPQSSLDDRSIVDWLGDGGDPERALELGRHAATRWSQ